MNESADTRVFTHAVDRAGVIVAVNDDWLAFARENDAPELVREAVVGRPLWDFIEDKETRHISRLLLDKAANTAKSIFVPYRCDSPGERRFLDMEIRPLADGTVEFRSRIVRSEKRKPVKLLERRAGRTGPFLAICSWCRRVRLDSEWVEVDEAVRRLDLFSSPELAQLTHGICSICDGLFRTKGAK